MSHTYPKSMLDELVEIKKEFEKKYGQRPRVMSGETNDLAALRRSLEGIIPKPYEAAPENLGGWVDTIYGIPIFAHEDVPPGVLRLYSPGGELLSEITGIGE